MNILILSLYYPPDGPGRLPVAVAQGLKMRGHNVKVLTGYPHYDKGNISHGYRQRFRYTEYLDGLEVRRVPIVPIHSKNPIGRIANYLSFAISARTAVDFVRGSDVIYVYGAPATSTQPAKAWSKTLGIPFVYHVVDIWPESVTTSGFLPRRVLSLMEKGINLWLNTIYSSSAAVIAIAPTAKRWLVERGVPANRIHLIYNWSDAPSEISRSTSEGLTLLYAGNLGYFQDLETVIAAAHRLAHLPGFQLKIAGGGVLEDQLRALVDELDLADTVQFLGRVEGDQMAALYASADFQVVPLKDLDFFAGTIPSKFQGGLAFGLPVITTVKGDVARWVEQNNLGFVAQPENVDDLSDAFLAAYTSSQDARDQLSQNARRFFDENFTTTIAIDRMEAILASVVKPGVKE